MNDLARRVEATKSELAKALRQISALEEQLEKQQPLHHVEDIIHTTFTALSVYPPTPSHASVQLPNPSRATVLPAFTQATDHPATSYLPVTSTPVLAGTHLSDIPPPAPTGVEPLPRGVGTGLAGPAAAGPIFRQKRQVYSTERR